MKFGDKLKIVRCALGLSQQELADRLGTTKQAISRYENSERDPNLRTAKLFSDKLGIDLTILADDNLYLPTPEKIRSERERRNWSKAQLADLLQISEGRLTSLEDGECFPTVLELSALANVFNASADWFLGLEWRPASTVPALNADELSVLLSYRHDMNNQPSNIVRIAGRDGSYMEKHLSDEQIKALQTILDQMPEAEDI